MGKRQPLTGVFTIEWVDAADPDDDTRPPNFGWLRCAPDPPLDDEHMVALLREIADTPERGLTAT